MTNTPALTVDQLKRHEDFVYRCVMDNTRLRSSAKFGVELNLTVQDLVHSNVATLRKIGTQIERVVKDSGSSQFSEDGPMKINGVQADKWIDFLSLQIALTKQVEDAEAKAFRIKQLNAQIDDLKTPEEKRKDLEKELNALTGVVAPVETLA